MTDFAILLSGGRGTRTSSVLPKQFVRRDGLMMVTHALRPLFDLPRISKICIVAAEDRRDEILEDIKRAGFDASKLCGFAEPGEIRQESVKNALSLIVSGLNGDTSSDGDTVLIHDAARPFLSTELLEKCYAAIEGHDGVMPVLPMKDTVYISRDGKRIASLLERSEIFSGQAPELFKLGKYYRANTELSREKFMKINGSTEPAVLYGMDIAMIPGDVRNIKVTTDEDMDYYLSGSGGKIV